MKREYVRNGKSCKYSSLRAKFRRDKRKSIRNNYQNFVSTLKTLNPGKWYKLAKQIGANNDQFDPTEIESLKGLTLEAAAEKFADFLAQTSNE